ncbi:hypothetical protein COY43_00955 [Candidatus Berkelbacteria bacterium CG_4_10_14_0_8_um_filter_35_9_33_8]|uniref:Uncharacterized protein n=1 Tax=Candidatus Berkelbacteria bacterium CG_4_10_14_0_2_um_filter_35_9_33_12 TaxID=1974499 RepID=A0A2M7W3R5_9BACT|nr:MAG: hypothetical protein COX10_02215 [Candidatus Berkelbacteria bacterium CG23_combo_of_CG06-09_8_20_14_all_33_15]PIS08246.1 MAG: hypothetical protein COT76_02515 [Candidatus Berkelbacteria bacterium CG10_big_fil_rev_8_21_14_0_10_33_10]PIZ28354.1 MAG: hypothetical protein COY43_00955 [Candidatus Berkelbacteria bacterium CG_4_10_14_0_8_um_filter_35_9_33_8]PJA20160.1 MAG: hypothetical protein COX60_02500 [Candidatus Berkelbacteria bacterium CG_4_10_14_0_2_um_filter_35_9_33_12]
MKKEGKINAPSWDLFIGLFMIIGISYGFILQREKTTVTILSSYVALVITQVLNPMIQGFFIGDKTIGSFFIRANISSFTIQSVVFALVIILLVTRSGIAGQRARGLLSPIEVMIYSILNSSLILSTILSFLPEEQKASIVASSKLASRMVQYHIWWLVLPAIAMIVIGFRKGLDQPNS